MNIRESLQQEHSKTQTLRIVAFIGNDTARMSALMTCFFDSDWFSAGRSVLKQIK